MDTVKPVLAVGVAVGREKARQLALTVLNELRSRYSDYIEVSKRAVNGIVESVTEVQLLEPEVRRYSAVLVVVTSGYSARVVYEIGSLGKPLIIVVPLTGEAVSCALEARNALLSEGYKVSSLVVYPDESQKLIKYLNAAMIVHTLAYSSILVVGDLPPWRLEGRVSETMVRHRLGSQLIKLQLEEIVARYEAVEAEESMVRMLEGLIKAASSEELRGIARMATALEKLMRDNNAVVASLDCSGVAERTGINPEPAVSVLLSQGYSVTCENDTVAAITDYILRVTGGTLIAKPSAIHSTKVVYTTCTPPLALLREPNLIVSGDGSMCITGDLTDVPSRVVVARLSPSLSRLYMCECSVARVEAKGPLSLHVEGCRGCIEDVPGSMHVLLLDPNVEALRAIRELTGIE